MRGGTTESIGAVEQLALTRGARIAHFSSSVFSVAMMVFGAVSALAGIGLV